MGNHSTQAVNSTIEVSLVEVPKKIHFVWLGKLGAIQQDYIRTWQQINPDYQITVWYDPQALLANELGKQIKNFAGQKLIVGKKTYFNKVIQLQNDAHKFISQAMRIEKKTFDQSAKEFMIANLNCSEENLENIRKENKTSYSDFMQQHSGLVQLADINILDDTYTGIDKYYYQELTLRQNLAAASDIVRLKMLSQQGGFYFDADLLPALNTTIFNENIQTKISQLSGREKAQIEFAKTQLILERLSVIDSSHFPAREALTQSYENYVDKFAQKGPEYKNLVDEIRITIDAVHTIDDFFQPLAQQYIESNSLRIAKHRGFRGINNNAIMAEAHSHKLQSVMETLAKNYQRLEQHNLIFIEKEGDQQTRYLNDPYAGIQFPEEANYRMDGLTESTATIEITGPGAILKAIKNNAKQQVSEDGQSQSFPIDQFSFDLFNTYTEEDAKSSWQKQHTASDFSYDQLLLAIQAKRPDLVRKLLAYQSLSRHDGFEWLSTAINNRDEETLRLLLEADVNPNSNNKVKKITRNRPP
ncbi:TcdA/TcdB catalytic glycosyltransferase domain-containing protein [Providencia burhodogranariea]|uniref:Glycosyltransferase n=1 Tax=Providencia burhodogranariea DSM 19968 TaxID=1141662 RepID=K8WS38_9GAMM|nr:TcdA/TcdB catalytic glycosyltransferase domain-containing protein [Providencia burhodogranariea]EKT60262.1 glycosyltransferase [Providencia burhodogranariea DSM 19968]